MKLKIVPLLIGGIVLGSATTIYAADWSDTNIGYRYGTEYREPSNVNDIKKNILSFTHVSGYKYGSNFFNVDMLASDNKDLASGDSAKVGGAHEVYVVYRTTVDLIKKCKWFRSAGLTGGFDFNAKDDQFSARVMKWAIGPKVSFDVPGYLNLAVVYRTERNHNWYASGSGFGGASCSGPVCNPNVYFDNTAALEAAWGIPFHLGAPLNFKGFLNYIGSKGKDGTGNQTKPETLLEMALMVDVGSFAGHKDTVFIGPGYQYWHNKFGNNASLDTTGGATAHVPQLEIEVHF